MIKAVLYLLKNDKKKILLKEFLKSPFFYIYRSLLSPLFPGRLLDRSYLFGVKDIGSLKKEIKRGKKTLLVFSYCQKPTNCPGKRFSKECKKNKGAPCRDCLIGKYIDLKSEHIEVEIVTTVNHYAELILKRREKSIIFITFACFFSINMFKRFPYILGVKGIAFPLSGEVCQNFYQFKSAEKNEKKDMTRASKNSEEKLLYLFSNQREFQGS